MNTRAHQHIPIACALVLVCACALLAAAAMTPSPALAAPGDFVPGFGTGGAATSNHGSFSDLATDIAIDTSANAMYVVGMNASGTNWYIEKRTLDTGALVASFDGDGIAISSSGSGNNDISIALDPASNAMYVVGQEFGAIYNNWRIEKRTLDTGALITSFDGDGIVSSSPKVGYYAAPNDIAIDPTANAMYVVGVDGSSTDQWRIEKRTLDTGALVTSFDGDGWAVSDPTAFSDSAKAIAIDPSANAMYVLGSEGGNLRIEKRRLDTGSFITAFDGDGILSTTTTMDFGYGDIIIDSTANAMYVAIRSVSSWRIEKRRLDTGALCTAANCGIQFGVNGVVFSSVSGSPEGPEKLFMDTTGIYMTGFDNSLGDYQWRIEKRTLDTGALVSTFGTGGTDGDGVVTNNPSSSTDIAVSIAADSTAIYIVGYDRIPGDFEWRIEKRESGASPPPPPPTVNLSAFPATITSGQSSTLSWTSTDATSCAAVSPAGWTSQTGTNGAEIVWPVTTTTYTISCTGPGGTTQQSTTVTVTAPVCANGDLIWGKIVDLAVYVTANDIAVDNNGIYIVGDEGGGDKWRMEKRDFSGNALWTQTFDNIPASGSETAQDVAVDSTGMYIVGGNYLSGNSYQWRIEKRNLNDGTLIWEQTSNPSNNDTGWQVDLAYGVAVDTTGVYVVGEESLPSAGDSSWRIEKRNLSDGSLLWVKEIDPDSSTSPYLQDRAMAVAVDGAGLYVVGWETTGWVIGPSVDMRWRIEKRDPASGNLIWARTSKYGPVNTQDRAMNVAIDSTGIYVIGWHYPPAGGSEDWRMEKWDLNGNQIWQQTYVNNGQDWAQSVAVDGTGVYVGGSIALGTYSAHMRKLSLTDGSLLWSVTTWVSFPQDPGEMTTANGLAVDCRGVYWAGDYNSGVDVTWTVSLREAGGSCGCGAGGGGTPPPTVSLTATPSTINSGDSSTLTWTSTDAASCAAVSPAGWTAKTTINDSQLVTNITATTTYTISCTGPGGTTQQSVTVTVNAPAGNDCGMRVYDGTATVTLDCENPATTTSLRIYKSGTTYGLKLVDPTDPNASRIRIAVPDGGGGTVIKAMRKQ